MKVTKSKTRQPGRVNALETGFESEDEIRYGNMYQSNKKLNSSSELETLLKSVQHELSILRTKVNTVKQKGEDIMRLKRKNLIQIQTELTKTRVVYVKDIWRKKIQIVAIVLNALERAIL